MIQSYFIATSMAKTERVYKEETENQRGDAKKGVAIKNLKMGCNTNAYA